MSEIEFRGSRVLLPQCFLRSMLLHEKRQATAIDGLRKRLQSRDELLTRALHELAVLRGARDPEVFIRQRKRGGAVGQH